MAYPHDIHVYVYVCVAIQDSTKFDQKSEKIDQKNEWGPMKKGFYDSKNFGLAMAYPPHITRYMCCDKINHFFWGN